ncbi:Gentisate 1,2-dioxygenase [hydrothermal vent metagenome]|uniref:Gentisate 1,2-dioxygenase n=1 Tax=hydrothermal vent metagenome TaxID=652676 RepID=A0A3B0X0U4_9ZZZZ
MNRVNTEQIQEASQQKWQHQAQSIEYMSAVNPPMPSIDVIAYPASLHETEKTQIIPFDLSKSLKTNYPATSPNLMAGFLHICTGETLKTEAKATSHVFYVIRGSGQTQITSGTIKWKTGDLFTLPAFPYAIHTATSDVAIYWVHDAPLLHYLGVEPSTTPRFEPVLYTKEFLTTELKEIRKIAEGKNRTGFLLFNPNFPLTMTLTHTLWALYNVLPAGVTQKPHRHNSIALDFCVSASKNTYTLIGKELDSKGNIINPIKANWTAGSAFITPPGWWHSHHNESDEDAIVLPIQDAGLIMNMQVLDFQHIV